MDVGSCGLNGIVKMHGPSADPSRLLCIVVLFGARLALGSSSQCTAFALPPLDGVVLAGTTYFKADAHVDISNLYSAIDTDTLPAFCRVQLVVTTNATANSSANTELWLPDDWNGRFLAVGNGGLAGGVAVGDLGFIAVQQGCEFAYF